jgi:hypothetical protein
VGEEYRYEYVHNVPIASLTATIFGPIVRSLLVKCDAWDDAMFKAVEEQVATAT